MRVLMIGPARSVHGGISSVVNTWYEAGLDKRVQLTYLATMRDGSKFRKLLCAGIALIRFLFLVGKADLVHVHMASDVSFVRKSIFIKLAAWKHKKIVLHQHGGDFEGYYKGRSLKGQENIRKVLNLADCFLVIAPVWKELFGRFLPESKILVLPNTIWIEPKTPKDYSGRNILFMGRICREKGIWELVEACGKIRKDYPNLKLTLLGLWEDSSFQKLIMENKEWILAPGWVQGQEKQEYLKKCNIFVMPSHFEGLCLALMEAMGGGCACIASNVGGMPSLVKDGESGLLAEPKSAKSLESALRTLLKHPDLQKQLGERAYETIARNYNAKYSAEQVYQLYERVLHP